MSQPFTYTFTVNSTGADEQVVAQTNCAHITVGEDASVANWPTADWKWKGPASTAYVQQPAGTSYTFDAPEGSKYDVGQVVAYVATITGSTTFSQKEQA